MSFTRQVKEEISRIKNKCIYCSRAELLAMLHMRGSLIKSREGMNLEFKTENTAGVRRLFLLFKEVFDLTPEIFFYRQPRLRKKRLFAVRLSSVDQVSWVLQALGLKVLPRKVNSRFLRSRCCRRAYIRGAFLANGSLTHPGNAYHLEIISPYKTYVLALKSLLSSFGLAVKSFKRKKDYVLYLKDGDKIVDFLRVIDAPDTLFNFEDVRIIKDIRSRINRIVNCETANLDKTVIAAQKQLQNIELIESHLGLHKLPPSLRCTAEIRRLYPDASLKELGEKFDPPLSKSGINHRLRRLNRIAEKIKSGSYFP